MKITKVKNSPISEIKNCLGNMSLKHVGHNTWVARYTKQTTTNNPSSTCNEITTVACPLFMPLWIWGCKIPKWNYGVLRPASPELPYEVNHNHSDNEILIMDLRT